MIKPMSDDDERALRFTETAMIELRFEDGDAYLLETNAVLATIDALRRKLAERGAEVEAASASYLDALAVATATADERDALRRQLAEQQATIDQLRARLAEVEADLDKANTAMCLMDAAAGKTLDEVCAERDAAVKRAEEVEACLFQMQEAAKDLVEQLKAAEQREAAALASLEALRGIWSDADTAHDLEEWEPGDIIHAGRKTVDALTTTEGAGKVLADLKEEAGFVVKRANREALSTGACIGCGSSPTCIGDYGDGLHLTCDECCGHGCEDGWCVPLALGERDKLRAELAEVRAVLAEETYRADMRLCPICDLDQSGGDCMCAASPEAERNRRAVTRQAAADEREACARECLERAEHQREAADHPHVYRAETCMGRAEGLLEAVRAIRARGEEVSPEHRKTKGET